MALTERQGEFLGKLVEIYRQGGEPVHYTRVADALGVSKWTAYDVMNVLEHKRMVVREYAVGDGLGLAGRSRVLFRPTEAGLASLAEESSAANDDDREWEETKERILTAIERHPASEYMLAAREVLGILDTRGSVRGQWASAMTALLLTADNLRCCMEQIPILRDVPVRVPSARARLTALAEVAATLSRKSIGEGALRRKLRDFAEGHSVLMDRISAAQQDALLRFLGTVMRRVRES